MARPEPEAVGARRIAVFRHPAARITHAVLRDPGGRFGLVLVVTLIGLALSAARIAPFDPFTISADEPLSAPSRDHVFGTDELGRDVLSRTLFGARISLSVAVGSAGAALLMAVPLGLLAGYLGGPVDMVISRLLDTIFAFPAVLLGIGVVALLGTGVANVVVAVAIISVPTLGRLTRVSVLSQRNEEYVQAARALGASGTRVVTRHILQNVVPQLLVQTALVMADAVLLEAGFSFLGLGSRPPTPSWGTMLDSGRNFLSQAPWLGIFPGLAVTSTILGLNALGDALRAALSPRRE
ncbi:MAG TPA: ABC transporter permease [Methylomirabilota bacterium]|nr:ABC transporter permease [Methylomirabilota bacterium]